jgi:hypothetical protein
MNKLILANVEVVKALAQRLAACSVIARYGEEEAWSLAYSLEHLERSMHVFLNEQLPVLLDPTIEGEKLEDLLNDIREEFRHILYHIHDPKFLRLVEPTHEWLTVCEEKGPEKK